MKLFYFILFFIFTGIIISYINYNNFKSNNIYLIIYISLLFGFILAYFVNYKKNKKLKMPLNFMDEPILSIDEINDYYSK